MLKMTSAKDYIWKEIIEADFDIETFKQCYQAISRVIPKEWTAIPRDIFKVFSNLAKDFESNSVKGGFGILNYPLDTFSVWLIRYGYGVPKDIETWNSLDDFQDKHLEATALEKVILTDGRVLDVRDDWMFFD